MSATFKDVVTGVELGLVNIAEGRGWTGFTTVGKGFATVASMYGQIKADLQAGDYGALVADTALAAAAGGLAVGISGLAPELIAAAAVEGMAAVAIELGAGVVAGVTAGAFKSNFQDAAKELGQELDSVAQSLLNDASSVAQGLVDAVGGKITDLISQIEDGYYDERVPPSPPPPPPSGPGPGSPGPGSPGPGSPGPGSPGPGSPGPGSPGPGSSSGPKHRPPPNPRDPLVLNFGSGGLNLTSLDNSQAHFDFTGSGFATKAGWIAPDEGLLIRDNGLGGGTITPDELLGAQSGSGFEDLAALDSNHDGVIDANDLNFGQLKVWVDQNLDGRLDSGELKSLGDLGVTSISLSRTPSGQIVNGNQVVEQATFAISGSSASHVISEVNFATSTIDTIYTPPAGFAYSPDALELPQLAGYGMLPSLRVSMSQNAALLADVKNFVLGTGSMSGAQFDAGFQALLWDWAGVSKVDPSSRGPSVDARHLAFLYAFYGIDPVSQPAFAANPNWHNGPLWEQLYQSIVDQLEVRFASQVGVDLFLNGASPGSVLTNPLTVFSQIAFDPSTDTVTTDLNALLKSVVQGAPSDPVAAQNYYDLTFRIVRSLRADYFNDDTSALTAVVLSTLDKLGIPLSVEQIVLGAFGVVSVDETAATGAVSISSANAAVFLGAGDKAISGGSNNFYIYSATSGNDAVSDMGGSAQLALTGLTSKQVVFQRPNAGSDLIVVNSTIGTSLTIQGYFAAGSFRLISLADGTSLTIDGIKEALRSEASAYLVAAAGRTDSSAQRAAQLAIYGFTSVIEEGAATGVLGASNADDVIFVGTGDKTISGLGGLDIYVYTSAGGNDVVDDDSGTLVMQDIASTGVTLSRPNGGN
ncbi:MULTISPECIES: hypothetical protein, partial [unclassified Bradyrhizobium]